MRTVGIACALFIALVRLARADDLGTAFVVGESVIPDLRLEWGHGTAIVLSFPAVVQVANLDDKILFDAWLEPQYRDVGSQWRGLAGGRVTLGWSSTGRSVLDEVHAGGLFAEAGGLIGTDGNGVVLGGGVSLFESHGLVGPSLVYRATRAGGQWRSDISIDLLRVSFNRL
jgi:hypothetical protein